MLLLHHVFVICHYYVSGICLAEGPQSHLLLLLAAYRQNTNITKKEKKTTRGERATDIYIRVWFTVNTTCRSHPRSRDRSAWDRWVISYKNWIHLFGIISRGYSEEPYWHLHRIHGLTSSGEMRAEQPRNNDCRYDECVNNLLTEKSPEYKYPHSTLTMLLPWLMVSCKASRTS